MQCVAFASSLCFLFRMLGGTQLELWQAAGSTNESSLRGSSGKIGAEHGRDKAEEECASFYSHSPDEKVPAPDFPIVLPPSFQRCGTNKTASVTRP